MNSQSVPDHLHIELEIVGVDVKRLIEAEARFAGARDAKAFRNGYPWSALEIIKDWAWWCCWEPCGPLTASASRHLPRVIRLLTAHRDQSSSNNRGWFPGSRTVLADDRDPFPGIRPVVSRRAFVLLPLRGQRRIFDRLPNSPARLRLRAPHGAYNNTSLSRPAHHLRHRHGVGET